MVGLTSPVGKQWERALDMALEEEKRIGFKVAMSTELQLLAIHYKVKRYVKRAIKICSHQT